MALTRLMLYIAGEGLLVTEATGEAFSRSEYASAITPDIHNQSVAEGEVLDDLVETALADLVGEAAHIEVADVIIEDAVLGA